MVDSADTIAAVATPPGRGGIGIVRLSGPDSLTIARQICAKDLQAGLIQYAAFLDAKGQIMDRGLVLCFRAPASYTGEDVVELHGHGGPVVLGMLLKRALELGARQARPGEFSERAYLNDKLDLVQAEAIAALIESASKQAARSAMRSLEGEFSAEIHALVETLTGMRAQVEGALDFPEEEIDFLADLQVEARLKKWQGELEALLRKAHQGRVLAEGLRVVIAGRPNVGKSSLLNRLTQTDRAIVSETPGTTRDLIEDHILIEGLPLSIADTAGLREATDAIEQEGMRRAIQAGEMADLVLLVIEAGVDAERQAQKLLAMLPQTKTGILLINKIDLVQLPLQRLPVQKGWQTLPVSAKTGEGLDELRQALKRMAGLEQHGEDVLLARARHIDALCQAGVCVARGLAAWCEEDSAELLAEELGAAQGALGSITGEFLADDLLGEIFSRFCIGK